MLAITMTVPPTRGTLIASSELTSGLSVYAVTMPSNSGIRKLCAHDKANTVASAARIPSAKPRASTCIRTAGKVTSDASTVESSCSTAPAESATPVAADSEGAFIARPRRPWGAHFCRLARQRAHFQLVDCLLTSGRSHSAHHPKNEKNEQNGSKDAATDIHVILHRFMTLY